MKKIKLKELGNIFRGSNLPREYLIENPKKVKKQGLDRLKFLHLTGRNIQDGKIVPSNRDRFLVGVESVHDKFFVGEEELSLKWDEDRKCRVLDESTKSKYSKSILKTGDIIVSSLWTNRKVYYYKKSDPPCVVGSNWMVLRTDHNEYLSKYFEIEDFYKKFDRDCQNRLKGGVIPFLSLVNFLEIEIFQISEKELLRKYDKEKFLKIEESQLLDSIEKEIPNRFQKEFLKKLIDDHFEDPVIKLSKQYENSHLEFKSSFKTDTEHGGKIPENKLIHNIIKTIGGFCNTGGGDLLIGVSDDNQIIGIEIDGFDNEDKFFQSLTQHIGNKTKPDVMNLPDVIDITFHKYEDKTICRVNVEPTQENVFVEYENDKIFFKRKGPKTVPLRNDELIKYVERKKKLYE